MVGAFSFVSGGKMFGIEGVILFFGVLIRENLIGFLDKSKFLFPVGVHIGMVLFGQVKIRIPYGCLGTVCLQIEYMIIIFDWLKFSMTVGTPTFITIYS